MNSLLSSASSRAPQAASLPQSAPQPTPDNRRAPARILIIEANETIARDCLATLAKAGRLEPRRVSNVAEGLQLLQTWNPQVLLIGDKFTGKSGIELCGTIREESAVPLIMLTMNSDLTHQLQCLNSGADECIVFPCEPPLFLMRVLCLMRRSYRYSLPPIPDAPRGAAQFQQPAYPRGE